MDHHHHYHHYHHHHQQPLFYGRFSGGKDSLFNCLHCVANGHEIVALANLHPPPSANTAELDSFCFQTVGHDLVEAVAECMALPLIRRSLTGTSKNQSAVYENVDGGESGGGSGDGHGDNDDDIDDAKKDDNATTTTPTTTQDEVEDLFELLRSVQRRFPDVRGVSVGAILSNYQRVRVEHVCARLGWTCLAYLWRQEQSTLVQTMFRCRLEAVVVKVAAMGLVGEDVGGSLRALYPKLERIHHRFDVHVAGEGGEYETIVVDCPLYRKRLVLDNVQRIIHSDDGINQVAYLQVNQYHLEQKHEEDYFVPVDEGGGGGVDGVDGGGEKLDLRRVQDLQKILGVPVEQEWPPLLVQGDKDDKEDDNEETKPALVVSSFPPSSSMSVCRIGDSYLAVSNVWSSSSPSSLSVEEQARSVLDRIGAALAQYGLDFAHVVMSHVYLSSMGDFGRANGVYQSYFGVNHPAARACVALPLVSVASSAKSSTSSSNYPSSSPYPFPTSMVGMQVLACFRPTERMHVQSVSYWAPANIGPYSQAVRLVHDERHQQMTHHHRKKHQHKHQHQQYERRPFDPIFIAGQIGMLPRSLELAADLDQEIRLSLQHVRSIASALLWNSTSTISSSTSTSTTSTSTTSALRTILRIPDDAERREDDEHEHHHHQRVSWLCAPVPETDHGGGTLSHPHPSPIVSACCYLSAGASSSSSTISTAIMERAHAELLVALGNGGDTEADAGTDTDADADAGTGTNAAASATTTATRGYQMPTVYVTVAGLPKDAHVEWEVVLWDPRNYVAPGARASPPPLPGESKGDDDDDDDERSALLGGIFTSHQWSSGSSRSSLVAAVSDRGDRHPDRDNDADADADADADDYDDDDDDRGERASIRVLEHQQTYRALVNGEQRGRARPLSHLLAVQWSGGRDEQPSQPSQPSQPQSPPLPPQQSQQPLPVERVQSILERRLRELLPESTSGGSSSSTTGSTTVVMRDQPLSIRCFYRAELGLNDEWMAWMRRSGSGSGSGKWEGTTGIISWLPVHSIHLPPTRFHHHRQEEVWARDIHVAILMQY